MNRRTRRALGLPRQPQWEPLREVDPKMRKHTAEAVRQTADRTGASEAEAREALEIVDAGVRVFMNKTYGVDMRPANEDGWVHLAIQRLDGEPVCPWADKQRIKNQLVGEQCEGVELFPAESRLLDIGNKYHLWCNPDPEFRLTLGWHRRRWVE